VNFQCAAQVEHVMLLHGLSGSPIFRSAPSGTVLRRWYDARESASCTRGNCGVPCYRMWARRSTDNGVSWLSDQTFSDVVSPLPAQPDPGIQATYAGDYDYASFSANQHLHAWVDGRMSIGGSSQQDAFHDRQSTAVRHRPRLHQPQRRPRL
jgi:hypothetical protein